MIHLTPVGFVRSPRAEATDDAWGGVCAEIELAAEFTAEALDGIEDFSHAEIVFYFDRAAATPPERGARHPRGNASWPRVGIFAQRGKDRPNHLGVTAVEVTGRRGRTLLVRGLDAVDGTPVLDIKPVMSGFLPRGEVREPQWARELMAHYWRSCE